MIELRGDVPWGYKIMANPPEHVSQQNVQQTVHDVTVERILSKTPSQAELHLVGDSGY